MSNISRFEQIRKATAEAIEKYRKLRTMLESQATRPPRPGDIYLFPAPAAIDVSWVVAIDQPEKELVFAVPADGHPLAGLTDVELSATAPMGPLVVRCGHGLWIHREEFRPELRVDILDERSLHRIQDKLAEIASGKVEGTASQREQEANPDYDDWLDEVERAADVLASALRIREEDLTTADFTARLDVATPQPGGETDPQLALAAASTGPLAELYEAIQIAPENAPKAKAVNYLYPGALFLLLEHDGVSIVYLCPRDHPPPELHSLDEAGKSHLADWKTTPRGTARRAFVPWGAGDLVRLRFGRGHGARDVTVRK
jgi:hypothetical protein